MLAYDEGRLELPKKGSQASSNSRINYLKISNSIKIEEPQILGQPVSEFVKFMMDRLTCFIEEVTIHCFQKMMPSGISLIEIPLSQRKSNMPLRFRKIVVVGGSSVWNINYNQSFFEDK